MSIEIFEADIRRSPELEASPVSVELEAITLLPKVSKEPACSSESLRGDWHPSEIYGDHGCSPDSKKKAHKYI
jgi:hypothetical protein